jgi:hypothetical protein
MHCYFVFDACCLLMGLVPAALLLFYLLLRTTSPVAGVGRLLLRLWLLAPILRQNMRQAAALVGCDPELAAGSLAPVVSA